MIHNVYYEQEEVWHINPQTNEATVVGYTQPDIYDLVIEEVLPDGSIEKWRPYLKLVNKDVMPPIVDKN